MYDTLDKSHYTALRPWWLTTWCRTFVNTQPFLKVPAFYYLKPMTVVISLIPWKSMEMNRTVYKDVSEGLKVKSDKTEQPVQTGETA